MSKQQETAQITTPAILKAHTFMYPEGTLDISKRLMEAVERNDFATAETLLASGADVNVADVVITETHTPLCLAVENNNKKMAELLLKGGANVNYSARSSSCPALEKAPETNSYELIKLLLIAGADLTIGHFRNLRDTMANDIRVTKLLLDIKVANEWKHSALFRAVCKNKLEVVKLLLSAGANPDHINWLDTLGCGVMQGNVEITQELIKAGAQIHIFAHSRLNPQIIALLETRRIADKIAEGALIFPSEKAFILDESLSIEVKTTFIERTGKLLAKKINEEVDASIDLSLYSDLPYIAQIKYSFYQHLVKLAATKILSDQELSEGETAILAEIKYDPFYSEIKKEFIADLCEKIAKFYKIWGYTISAEKYSDILGTELVKIVNESKEIKNIKDEVLSYFVDIISNLLGFEHIPPAEALEEGADVSAKYEILRTQLIEAYKPEELDKINLTNKIFAIIQKAIENPVKSLFELLAIDRDGIGASIDSFLKEPSMGVLFDERQANIYRSLYEMNDKGIISNSAVKHLIAEHFSHFFRGYDVTIEAGSFEESHAAIDTPAAGGAGASAVDKDEGMSESSAREGIREENIDGFSGLSIAIIGAALYMLASDVH